MANLSKGDIIYRIYKYIDGNWYFCIYEVVSYKYFNNSYAGHLLIAPILTYYEADNSSVSSLLLQNISENWIETWAHPWDYVTTDENMAKCMYYEKIRYLKQ